MILKRRDGAEQAAREALDIRLRAERFVGERLRETVRSGGSPEPLLRDETKLPTGVSRLQSHRYQHLASLADDIFEEELAKPDPSTARLVMLARRLERTQRNAALPEEEKKAVRLSYDLA